MEDLVSQLHELGAATKAWAILRAGLILVGGLVCARLVGRLVPAKRLRPQHQLVARRAITYAVFCISVAWALRELGVSLSVLLGTAGILTIAVGFAAQTSASNFISGLFLMGEQPFTVGDIVRVADTLGTVTSIDLLSVKLKTFDNLLVRIPNETMLKSNVTNMTAFPIRRVDLKIGIAYKEEIGRVTTLLEQIAEQNPLCLQEPKPIVMVLGFGDSCVDLQFSIWGGRENFLQLRTGMYTTIKKVFDEQNIEIPFPHRTIYTGSATAPLPVRILNAGSPDNDTSKTD